MAWRFSTLVGVFALAFAGCEKPKASWQYPTPSPTTRPADVPSSTVVTLPTQADLAAAVKSASDPAIAKAVQEYLRSRARRWEIVASRNVGDYVLLWISFPEFADSGIDLVYSKGDQRVRWQFNGGERG